MSDGRPLAGTGFVLSAVSGGPRGESRRVEVSRPSEDTLALDLAPRDPGGPGVRLASIDLPTATVEPLGGDSGAELTLVNGRGEPIAVRPGLRAVELEPGDTLLVAGSGVALRWTPWEGAEGRAFRAWLRADEAAADRVREAFVLFCERDGVPGTDVHDLALALQETLDNVVEHGYRDRPRGVVLVEAAAGVDGRLRVTVRDRGPAFDPESAPAPGVESRGATRLGGFGLHLLRSLVDTLEYERRDGENRLVLAGRLAEA